jgi:hypothetical protein
LSALVPFIATWVKSHAYDGVYFDEYFKTFDLSRYTANFPSNAQFDGDGDGTPDTAAEMAAQYTLYQKELSAKVRCWLALLGSFVGVCVGFLHATSKLYSCTCIMYNSG